jgi:hypothetical protein
LITAMGFCIYDIQPLAGNRFALHFRQPLSLGGPHGLLARRLPMLAKNREQWSLAPEELLRWAGLAIPESGDVLSAPNRDIPGIPGVFFDLTPGDKTQVNLFALAGVSGRTASLLTDVLFHFKVAASSRNRAKMEGPEGEWIVPDWSASPDRFEPLRLTGGTRGGDWAWAEPPQAASATVL